MIMLSQLCWLYKEVAYVPVTTDQNVLGIAGSMSEYPSQADLMVFVARYRTDAETATFTIVQINGNGYDPSHPGIEANFNIQYK